MMGNTDRERQRHTDGHRQTDTKRTKAVMPVAFARGSRALARRALYQIRLVDSIGRFD